MSKKLLYITNGVSGSGGLERVLSIKLHYLIEHFGYEIHVITLNQESSELFYNFNKNINFHNIVAMGKLKFIFNYIFGLRNLVKKINPDLISVCDDGIKGFFIPWFLNIKQPIIYERHASKMIFKKSDKLNAIERLNFKIKEAIMDIGAKSYNTIIVLTNENLKEWKNNNIKVIPNPLSFYPEKKSTLLNKKVITVGNHGFQKGYDRLLEIWSLVSKNHPEWILNFYGKMDIEKKHLTLAKKLRLNKHVSFFEPVKEIQEKYNEASIYLMSSRSEGFGMVLIEAMACGLPCIAFDCPSGPKDIISDGIDGFLIPNGDQNKFIEKINELIQNQELRLRMGENARNKAKSYLPNNIIPQWDSLFKSLIANQKI